MEAAMIFSDEAHIENKSEVPVAVTASVTGSLKSGSDLVLASSSFDPAATKSKRAFMYFEMQACDDPEAVTWVDEYDAEKHIVVSAAQKMKKNIVTLAAGGEKAAADATCYGAFRLAGICSDSPTKPWTSKDGVNVNIVFAFTPLPTSTTIE